MRCIIIVSIIKGLFVWAFGQLQLLPTTLNCFQLLTTAHNRSQPLPTASYHFRLLSNCLSTAHNCFQLLTTALNCSQLLTTAHNSSQLLSTANCSLQPLKRTGPKYIRTLSTISVRSRTHWQSLGLMGRALLPEQRKLKLGLSCYPTSN